MNKEQIGMLHFAAQIQGEDAVMIRFFRDGTVVREGGGGLPPIGVMGQFRGQDNKLFQQVLDLIPDAILEKPLVWQAPEQQHIPVDFKVLCYGLNRNGGVGMDAEWGNMSGLRVVFDLQKPPPNALISLADKLINAAKAVTNRMYFDLMVKAALGHHSSVLPENASVLAVEEDPAWLERALGRYVVQLAQINPNLKLEDFPKGKFYKDIYGKNHIMTVALKQDKFSYRFMPA